MTGSHCYVVVATKSWNRTVFDQHISKLSGEWHFIDCREALGLDRLQSLAPRYVFFLHWSWKVPEEITSAFECICFHMTDVPYGRGGSPLQNLIASGRRETLLSALRMEQEMDAGAVYMKRPLSLEGGGEEIFMRCARLAAEMVKDITESSPSPTPQDGPPVIFKRRRPADSEIPVLDSLQALHDFVRMLDAEGYPPAYIETGAFRLEFRRPALYNGRLVADVCVTMKPEV